MTFYYYVLSRKKIFDIILSKWYRKISVSVELLDDSSAISSGQEDLVNDVDSFMSVKPNRRLTIDCRVTDPGIEVALFKDGNPVIIGGLLGLYWDVIGSSLGALLGRYWGFYWGVTGSLLGVLFGCLWVIVGGLLGHYWGFIGRLLDGEELKWINIKLMKYAINLKLIKFNLKYAKLELKFRQNKLKLDNFSIFLFNIVTYKLLIIAYLHLIYMWFCFNTVSVWFIFSCDFMIRVDMIHLCMRFCRIRFKIIHLSHRVLPYNMQGYLIYVCIWFILVKHHMIHKTSLTEIRSILV